MTPSEALKRAILKSGQTRYRVAKEAGISWPTLDRFLRGERDIYMATADRLCAYLGLELTIPTTTKWKGRRP
jgi:plasmid maintenance system antidote protein VapI